MRKRRLKVALLMVAFFSAITYMYVGCAKAESEYETVRARAAIDFSAPRSDTIHPLHGINNGPVVGYQQGRFKYNGTRFFEQAGIPYVRTHDVEYPYGGDLFVDIHCIFPDFNADPALAESYHFEETDLYIKAILDSGSQVFFRLGESIDRSGNHLYIDPPADYKKWAQICEGIINHYNYGFADGFYYNIEYWEIGNEPEGGANWTGTPEQFYEFYKVSATYLKEKFPKIKIGGYGATVSKEEFFLGFLDYITQGERAPLDFFSWHVYAANPLWLVSSCQQIPELLKQYGYENTELILDEWNYNADIWDEALLKKEYKNVITAPRGAAYLAAVLITMQNYGVDKAMYYDTQFFDIWNGLFTKGYLGNLRALPGLNSFTYFNQLYQAGSQVPILVEGDTENLYLCAAKDQTKRIIMAANYCAETKKAVEVTFRLDDKEYSSVQISQTDSANVKGKDIVIEEGSNMLTWTLPPDSVALFVFE